MPELPFSMSFIVFPFPLISSIIRPCLGPIPIPFRANPLTVINSAAFKFKRFPFLSDLAIYIRILVEFDGIFVSEIIVTCTVLINGLILNLIFLSRFFICIYFALFFIIYFVLIFSLGILFFDFWNFF